MIALSRAVLAVIRIIVGSALILSVLLICANAVARYLFLAPIIWAEEILGYVLVWTVYLGAVLVTWEGGHLKMDLVSKLLPPSLRAATNGLGVAAFLVIGGVIVYQAVGAISTFTHVSQVAELPMNVVHTVVPVAFALMMLAVLVRLRAHLSGALDDADRDRETDAG